MTFLRNINEEKSVEEVLIKDHWTEPLASSQHPEPLNNKTKMEGSIDNQQQINLESQQTPLAPYLKHSSDKTNTRTPQPDKGKRNIPVQQEQRRGKTIPCYCRKQKSTRKTQQHSQKTKKYVLSVLK
jgi:hypothetical protein